jgi:AcrR family transcriptional regulator
MTTKTKGDLRRAEILELARRILIDDGYDCFVLREIANRAGMKLGNLQYYFATREDLLEAVISAELERDLAAIREPSARATTPEQALREGCARLVETWSGESGKIWVVLAFLAMHTARFRECRARIYAGFYAELSRLVGRLRPSADDEARLLATQLITSLIDGASMQMTAGASSSLRKRQARRLLDEAIETAVQIARRA